MGGVDHDGYATCSRRGHSIRYFVLAWSTRKSTELTLNDTRKREGGKKGSSCRFYFVFFELGGQTQRQGFCQDGDAVTGTEELLTPPRPEPCQ